MKKFLIALAAALVLCVPVFAENDVYFASDVQCVRNNVPTSSWTYTSQASNPVYYYFADNSGIVLSFAISDVSGAPYLVTLNSDNSTVASGTVSTLVEYNGNSYYISNALNSISKFSYYTLDPALSVFPAGTTQDQILAAFGAFLDSNQMPSVQSSFNIPCGNVVYFQVSAEQDVTFKSYNQILSSLLTFSALGPWGDTGQRYGPAASLPSSGASFPLLSQDPIHWNIDASSVNFLGQSRTAIKTVHCITGQWYAFYNPAYNSNNTDWTVNDITGATVGVFGSFSQVKVYPLEQVVDFSNGTFVGSSNDDYQSYYDGTIGDNGSVTFTDQDGNISNPTAGGQNLLAPNESYQSLIDRVIGILDEIVHELKSLFTFGYEAVQDLVGIMRDFVNVLSGLYTWLPAEVYSALMSAVVVAIVIGVFKVFL